MRRPEQRFQNAAARSIGAHQQSMHPSCRASRGSLFQSIAGRRRRGAVGSPLRSDASTCGLSQQLIDQCAADEAEAPTTKTLCCRSSGSAIRAAGARRIERISRSNGSSASTSAFLTLRRQAGWRRALVRGTGPIPAPGRRRGRPGDLRVRLAALGRAAAGARGPGGARKRWTDGPAWRPRLAELRRRGARALCLLDGSETAPASDFSCRMMLGDAPPSWQSLECNEPPPAVHLRREIPC